MLRDIMCVHNTAILGSCTPHCAIDWQTTSTLAYKKNRASQCTAAPISESSPGNISWFQICTLQFKINSTYPLTWKTSQTPTMLPIIIWIFPSSSIKILDELCVLSFFIPSFFLIFKQESGSDCGDLTVILSVWYSKLSSDIFLSMCFPIQTEQLFL